MTVSRWFRWLVGSDSDIASQKYWQAVSLTEEVAQQFRERAASPDPIRAMMADLWLQRHDPTLIADAYQASQESRIYKGPPEPR